MSLFNGTTFEAIRQSMVCSSIRVSDDVVSGLRAVIHRDGATEFLNASDAENPLGTYPQMSVEEAREIILKAV